MAGLDKDYQIVPEGAAAGTGAGGGQGAAGGVGGDAGNSGTGGQGAAGAAGATGGSGGSPGGEDCGNGADDDGDGKVDCFDTDCAAASVCAGKCSDAATLSCNTILTEQSSGAAGSTERLAPPAYECASGLRPGPEYAYRLAGNPGDQVFVAIYGLAADLDLFMVEVAEGEECDAAQGCRESGAAFAGNEPEAASFTISAGRDYFVIVDGWETAGYSISTQCSASSTCRPVRAIQAGQTINASNVAGSAPNVTDAQEVYDCGSGGHTAPEAAFMFTAVVAGNYEVSLSGLGANLDVFVLAAPDCNTHCLNATSRGVNASSQNERFTFAAEAHTTYYIVVDGFGVSSFALSINAV